MVFKAKAKARVVSGQGQGCSRPRLGVFEAKVEARIIQGQGQVCSRPGFFEAKSVDQG